MTTPLVAGETQEITFAVGHGCEGSDTYSVTIDIPAGVTSVRAVDGDFGKATVNRDDALNVVSVTWQKADADLKPGDEHFYKLTIRAKVPNAPFTGIYFPAHQTCKSPDGTISKTEWTSAVQTESETPGAPSPAPAAAIIPPRKPGWNKYVVPAAVPAENMVHMFGGAQIVWKGNAAYSVNPATVEQIAATEGVTALTALAAGDEIWVKY